MYKVITHETEHNTYYIGYGKTSKTSYEQQQEHKERFNNMVIQRIIIVGFIVIMTLLAHFSKPILGSEANGYILVAVCIGIPCLLYDKYIFGQGDE